jgi:16S rRNA (guanine966-N2)-methyltransferase
MGIEALSRGAAHAVFVERKYEAAAAIHDNLDRTRLADRATVLTLDVSSFVTQTPPTNPFDLVLLDPPYDIGSAELERVLGGIGPETLSDQGWTVVLTRGFKSSTPVIPIHWAVARQLRYGDSLVILYREVSWA